MLYSIPRTRKVKSLVRMFMVEGHGGGRGDDLSGYGCCITRVGVSAIGSCISCG